MNDIGKYIGPVLCVILVPVILGCMFRRVNRRARRQAGVTWLEYGAVMKAFALFAVGIAVAMIVVGFSVSPEDKGAVLCMVALCGGLSLPLVAEFFIVGIGFDSERIYCRSGWRRNRIVDWDSVESACFSPSMQWWVVRTKKSGEIRAHVYLSGLSEFLAELQKRGIQVRSPSAINSW